MMGFITDRIAGLFGSKSEKDIKSLWPVVDQINAEWRSLQALSNDELRAKTDAFRQQIREGLDGIDRETEALKQQAAAGSDNADVSQKEGLYAEIDRLTKKRDEKLEEMLERILPSAFAVMKETASRFKNNTTLEVTATALDRELAVSKNHIRVEGDKAVYHNSWTAAGNTVTWDMMHYDVQLIGGIVLHQGKIAEMATGEGKTLVATLPAYLNGLAGLGLHIVTVNDYLACRDSEWMGPLLEFLGLRADCIDKYPPHSPERRKAYQADVIYGTNNEFGFDYLRDNMVRSPDEMVQRKHHYAMVDEVDSVLVDDARTPLIISGPVPKGEDQQFHQLRPRVFRLVEAQKKVVTGFLNDARKLVAENKDGEGGLALLRAHRGLPKTKPLIKYLSETGIRTVLQKTENHYLQDNSREMPKVDAELYFVIDEKNNSVELTEKGIELITGEGEDPNFFVLPDMGTELAEIERSTLPDEEKLLRKDKLLQEFSVKSERIHAVHQLLKAYSLFEKDVEYVVMDGKVKIVDENTGRILEGRRYSDGLHQAIEAKENVKIEAATQTFATITLQNYFRMYHKLAGMTGTAETEAGELWQIYKLDVVVIPTNVSCIRDDREDLVYKTKREKYNAVIDEIAVLTGKGRPVLVGTTSVEVSELLGKMLKLRGIKHNVLNAKQHQREAEIVAEAGRSSAVTIATNMAGRGTDIKLGPGVKEAGGLAIVGTERHESRRIDRQLRGRAGRQGDPGTSQFFVSLEDDLMRLFGSDRIARLMDRMGYKEGEVLQHSMITRSIERAQKKVEENNFGIRKRLLEYDDVMNAQRELIYKKRKHALFGERLSIDLYNTFYDVCDSVVTSCQPAQDFEAFRLEMLRCFSTQPDLNEEDFLKEKAEDLARKIFDSVTAYYQRKGKQIASTAYPVFKDILASKGESIRNVVVPFTDGKKILHVVAELQKACDTEGRSLVTDFEKAATLAQIDEEWKEHLREMDDLKQSVQGAVYEQKDPLLVYKFEAFNLFKQMLERLNRDSTAFLFKAQIMAESPGQVREARPMPSGEMRNLTAGRDTSVPGMPPHPDGRPGAPDRAEPVRTVRKTGRNEPCPCGSGKKYKHCHGKMEA